MGAPSKRQRKIRVANEFDLSRLQTQLAFPHDGGVPLTSWTLAEIFNARDLQLRGYFSLPVRMSESMKTDDALAVAFENRLDPQRCIKVSMEAAKGARGAMIASEADASFGQEGVSVHPDTVADIHGTFVEHGLAIGYNIARVREDGSRIDFEHREWPLEYVRVDPLTKTLKTRVDPTSLHPMDLPTDPSLGTVTSFEVPIVHGDGRWTVYSKHQRAPWTHGAILAAALVWARHAYPVRDWAKSSLVHGSAKLMGELPQGVRLQEDGGVNPSPEAAAFIKLLRILASADNPIGIRPFGSKTEFIANNSTAWQVFSELVNNAERAAARIYLGTDGTLGAKGGAPGVDIMALFGVAATKVEGDLKCISRCMKTGVLEPWTAINFGDSTLTPSRVYELPDRDEDARIESRARRSEQFYTELDRARAGGMVIDQAFVDDLAEEYGVDAPMLSADPVPAASGTTLRRTG